MAVLEKYHRLHFLAFPKWISQNAKKLNSAVLGCLSLLDTSPHCLQILHQPHDQDLLLALMIPCILVSCLSYYLVDWPHHSRFRDRKAASAPHRSTNGLYLRGYISSICFSSSSASEELCASRMKS